MTKKEISPFGAFHERIRENNYNIPIFKFIPFDFVASIIQKNEMLISKTSLWEDVYENFLLKSALSSQPEGGLARYTEIFYGQCWTFKPETDALWRIYSPMKQSVRIKTTIRKLLHASHEEKAAAVKTVRRLIAPVRYFQASQFQKWVHAGKRKVINEPVLLESLFLKRKAFAHESEVRIILQKEIIDQCDAYNPFVRVAVKPNEFIDEIMFDPRISKEQCSVYTHLLRSIGFKKKILRSSLYDFQPL
jgi:hypothetical protein